MNVIAPELDYFRIVSFRRDETKDKLMIEPPIIGTEALREREPYMKVYSCKIAHFERYQARRTPVISKYSYTGQDAIKCLLDTHTS
jgi:hypothetical protein